MEKFGCGVSQRTCVPCTFLGIVDGHARALQKPQGSLRVCWEVAVKIERVCCCPGFNSYRSLLPSLHCCVWLHSRVLCRSTLPTAAKPGRRGAADSLPVQQVGRSRTEGMKGSEAVRATSPACSVCHCTKRRGLGPASALNQVADAAA